MYELKRNEEINRLIGITKSDSGISGPKLVEAHRELGRILGEQLRQTGQFDPKETTIVAMLRGGIFFAEGMYCGMECKFGVYDPKHESFVKPPTKHVILADSVINTGKTMLGILEPSIYVACCVIQESAVPMFTDRLFTVRVSKNSYVGEGVRKQKGNVGPDTTMRLFNLL